MEAYSEATGKHYPSWEALVEAEANGYVAVAIITRGLQSWPWVVGPFSVKDEAERARSRMRSKWRRGRRDWPGQTARFFVRPAWKYPRDAGD